MSGKGASDLRLEERRMIEKLIKDGRTNGNIAYHINRTGSCVKKEILRHGGRANYSAVKAQEAADLRRETKNAKISKGLLPSEQEIVKKLALEGHSINSIRSKTAISRHLLTRFLRESGIAVKSRHYLSFEDRITQLELQMEILIDQVRELKNRK